MLNFLGFFVVIGFLGFALANGMFKMGIAALREGSATAQEKYPILRFHYICLAAQKTVNLLIAHLVASLSLFIAAITTMKESVTASARIPLLLYAAVCLLFIQLVWTIVQRMAIPRFERVNGVVQRHGPTLTNGQPNPFGGLKKLDPSQSNRLEWFSLGWSLAIMLATTVAFSSAFVWLGIMNESRAPITIGGLYLAMVLIVFHGVSTFAAWVFQKGSDLLEFIATQAVQLGMLASLGYTKDNIHQLKVDLVDQEKIAAIMRSIFIKLLLAFILFFAPVWAWPNELVAELALGLIFLGTFLDYRAAKYGHGELVHSSRAQFAKTLRHMVPWVYVLMVFLSRHHGIYTAVTEIIDGVTSWIEQFLTGIRRIPVLSEPWACVGLIALSFALFLLFHWFNKKLATDKAGPVQRFFGNVHGLTALLCSSPAIIGALGLFMIVGFNGEVKAISLPKTKSAIASMAKHAPVAPTDATVIGFGDGSYGLKWKNGVKDKETTDRNNAEHMIVQTRESEYEEFRTIMTLKPSRESYLLNPAPKPGKSTTYRVVARDENGGESYSNEVSVTLATITIVAPKSESVATEQPIVVAVAAPQERTCSKAFERLYKKSHDGKAPSCVGRQTQ